MVEKKGDIKMPALHSGLGLFFIFPMLIKLCVIGWLMLLA